MNESWYIIYITIPKIGQEIKVGFYTEKPCKDQTEVLNHALNELDCEYINVDKLKEYQQQRQLEFEIVEGETEDEFKRWEYLKTV